MFLQTANSCGSKIRRDSHLTKVGTVCGVALSFVLPLALAQSKDTKPSTEPAQELARRVLANELKSEQQDHSHWMFLLKTYKAAGQSEFDQVIETKEGDVKRPISINGRGLKIWRRPTGSPRSRRHVRRQASPGWLRLLGVDPVARTNERESAVLQNDRCAAAIHAEQVQAGPR